VAVPLAVGKLKIIIMIPSLTATALAVAGCASGTAVCGRPQK
jgi:hypothetical protein